ncbi:MAG: PRD domain-containing protein [Streptococcus sp.]|nr:PRD domain-containing protein [Streptococcus sp.]
MEKQMNDRIPYPYNVNIFLHLYIMLERSRNFQVYLETNEDYSYKDYDSEIWRLATQIISNLNNYIGFKISENEIFYLNQYLVASRLHKDFISEQRFPDIVIKITNYYIDNLSCCLDILDLKELIFLDLANHINPMIKRLKNKIHVKNSLLNPIKLIYGLLFKEISKCSKDVEEIFSLNPISDDENGFITLYFAKMMELNLKKIKCIIVCSTGIGISELLKAKISKSFSEIEIIDVLSAREFMKEKLDVDLDVSTISLDIDTSQFLLISGMFTEDDKELLKRKVREIRGG